MTLEELRRIAEESAAWTPWTAKYPQTGRGTVYDRIGAVVADFYTLEAGEYLKTFNPALVLKLVDLAAVAQRISQAAIGGLERQQLEEAVAALEAALEGP